MPKTYELQTVDIMPDSARAPLFMGKYPMREFLIWVSKRVKYPKGYETRDDKVVVSFVITDKGRLDSIKIISQPEARVFGQQVAGILLKCPHWEPARLADGTPVTVSYTLPVKFRRERK